MSILSSIQRKIKLLKYKKNIPVNPRHDDLYIVEFPKSGITWISHIFGNLNLLLSKIELRVTRFNLNQVIPNIHDSRYISIKPIFNGYIKFRFIKSHASYNPYYKQIVYLLRNPFNVMISYHRYLTQLGIITDDFSSFIRNDKYGINAWVNHVEGWTVNKKKAIRMYLLKYEQLLEDPVCTIYKLYESWGFEINEDIVKKAVNLSSIENMRKDEKNFKKNNPTYKIEFVNKENLKVKEDKKNQISDDDYNYIYTRSELILKKYYPEFANSRRMVLNNETSK